FHEKVQGLVSHLAEAPRTPMLLSHLSTTIHSTCPVLRRSSHLMRSRYVFSGERRWPSGTIPSTAQRTARLLVLGFELADHSLGLVVEGGDDLDGVLFRVV